MSHTCWLLSAATGDLATLRRLVERNPGLGRCQGQFQHTLLHKAARSGQARSVEYLLKEGDVDVEARDVDGWTALYMA